MDCFGIDLGTSNCIIGKINHNIDDTYDVKCITNDYGESSFPSVITFMDENTYKIGTPALDKLITDPDSTIELIKIRLGKTNSIGIRANDKYFEKTPQEISSYILKHFEHFSGRNIEKAVITVPAFFDQSQKDSTMQAGVLSNINVETLIEEPTAAILYHIFYLYKSKGIEWLKNRNKKNVLVFDFGGGTLDLSLIKIEIKNNEAIPEVLAIGGDPTLGGNIIDFFFTKLIIEFLYERYNDPFIQEVQLAYNDYFDKYINGSELKFNNGVSNDVKKFIFRLKRNVERIKITLSSSQETDIILEGKYEPIPMSRKIFESIVLESSKINIKEKIENSLRELTQQHRDVDEILLVGGSTQIPLIQDIILNVLADMNVTKDYISYCDDFENAVAKGAAIHSAIVNGIPIPPFMNNKCLSIVPRDIVIEHVGRRSTFVEKGTPYPFENIKEYDISVGHSLSETVNIKLFEILPDTNEEILKEICNFKFYLPIFYTNDLLNIKLNIDNAGLYLLEAYHDLTNESVEYEPTKLFSLSEEEIKELKSKSDRLRDIT